jgi:acetylglutamate kinase
LRVIKLGGNELDRPGLLVDLASAIRLLPDEVVVVHGGGAAVDDLQQRLGIVPRKIDGMRVTDDDSLQAVVMTLCGWINKRIVAALLGQGVDAVGLSGVDGAMLRVRKLVMGEAELGWVGEITDVRVDLLNMILAQGMTPVVASVSLGPDGQLFNVNADQAAAALAAALQAEALDFVSNVEGVVIEGTLVPTLDDVQSARFIDAGKIHGGMVPKVNAALEALSGGVSAVRIVDLQGLPDESAGTTLRLGPILNRQDPTRSESHDEG